MKSWKPLTDTESQEIYEEGYRAGSSGIEEYSNPYTELAAEFWSDGHADALEDNL